MKETDIVQALRCCAMVYSRGRLVYVADLGQIMLAKLTPTAKETKC